MFKGKHKNLGIRYEYTLPSNSTDDKTYHWKLSDFTPCTKTCGGGIQQRFPVCYKRYEGIVEEELCWKNAENKRPEKISRTCNDEPCPAYWWVGPWQPCSMTCERKGNLIHVSIFTRSANKYLFADAKQKPMKKRTILCVDQNEYALPSEQCSDETRPSDFEPCSLMLPPCSIDDNTLSSPDFSDDENNEIPDTI